MTLGPSITPITQAGSPWESLSAPEREVVTYVGEGLTTAQIAERISVPRAKVWRIIVHLANVVLLMGGTHPTAGRNMEGVIDAMLPDSVPSPAEAWHAQQNAEARVELLAEFAGLTAEQVADQAGSTARNRSALASRWRGEGRIVGVSWHARTLYPSFQFREGQPHPVVERALKILSVRGLSGWALALWFVTPSGLLADRRPVDLIDEDPELVLAAVDEALSLPA